jgi:iron complex outermembrane receptor protein
MSSIFRNVPARAGRKTLLMSGAVAALAVLTASGAMAQQTPPPAAPPAVGAPPSADTLSTVVVTARRKAENLQNVPLAITALTAENLSAASATSLQDITFLTPGLTYTSNGQEADALPVIRGLSDTSGGESSSANVSIFLDGIYIANPSAIDLSLGGLDRVEVVKGPVSGLYGRNAFTGAINYVTAKPTDHYHLDASVTGGDYGKTAGEVLASGPIIGDLLKGSIDFDYDHLDGTYTDPVSHMDSNGHNKNDVLATLLFTPDSHIAITPVVYYGEDHFNDPTAVSYKQNCAFGTDNSYCGSLNSNQLGPFTPSATGADATGLTRRVEHVHVDSKFSYDFGTIDVLVGFNHIATKSINEFTGTENGLLYDLYAPGLNNPFAGNPPVGTALAKSFFGNQATEKDASAELRYDTPQQYPIRFSVGGYYFHKISTNNNTFGIDGQNIIPTGDVINFIAEGYVTANGASPGPLNFAKQGTRDYSPYVSGEWDILHDLTLSAAVRSTEEEQTSEGTTAAGFAEKDFHSITSNEALTWKPERWVSLYVSAANGEKSGGFNGAGVLPVDQTFNPETDWDYEGGMKSTLLDGHLRLDLAVFHTDINNQQVLGPQSSACPTSNASCVGLVVKNIGSYSVTGVEASEEWVVGNGFKISSGISYNPARFDSGSYDFNNAGPCALVASCAASRLVTVDGVQAENIKGLRPPFESDVTFNVTAEYRRPLGFAIGPLQNVDYFLRGDYRFESDQYTNVDDFAYYGPRNVFNIHGGLTNGTWTLTGYVLNLTNDQTPVTEQENGSLNGFDAPPNGTFGVTWVPVAALPQGRTYAFTLAYHY